MSNPQAGTSNSLGLAVGATYLAGAGAGQRPVVRPATVTLDQGAITGFVDRVGDPVPMVAQDGSQHRPEMLLAVALDELARGAADGVAVSEVGVAVPAHWSPQMVDALRRALQSQPGLARSPLVPDAAAALTALRSNPGLPSTGVIVLCDFGGSGTSVTLVDAARNDAVIGETVRLPDFSGDQIDQALLTKVVAGIFEATDADPSGTAMVGSLTRLREECRRAKERLSDESATAIAVDLPGLETNVRITRMELDDLIAGPLDDFLANLIDTLDRNRVPLAGISAVATVGGGARIPLITQRLSEQLRTRLVTTPHPQLTAAEGVALIAHRSRFVETATALASAAPATATVAAAAVGAGAGSAAVGALAWSEVEDDGPHDSLATEPHFGDEYSTPLAASRPDVLFTHEEREDEAPSSRRRSPALLFGLAAAAVVVAATAFGLTALTRDTSTVPAGTSSTIAPPPAAPAAVSPAPASEAPAPRQVVTTVVGRPQPRVAPRQQAPVVQHAPQQPAPAPASPAPSTPSPAPSSPSPPPPEPEPQNPAPEDPPPPADPGTGTPPIDPGTGGDTGTGTPPIDPGTGGGDSGTGTGTEGGGEGGAQAPAEQGLVAPALKPLLEPVLEPKP